MHGIFTIVGGISVALTALHSLMRLVRRCAIFPTSAIAALQEIPDKALALKEVRRVLKPGGILAVTELFQDPDYPLRSTSIKDGAGAGFAVQASLGNLWHYTIRFMKL